MVSGFQTPSFRNWKALVLHRPHTDRDNVTRQMERLGIEVTCVWPEIGDRDEPVNVVAFDVDMGHDGQFPWQADEMPVPMIALTGTEAPGRLEWAIRRGAGAHLNKPIGSSGVFGALVVAQRAFEERQDYLRRIGSLEERLARRPQVAAAIVGLMNLHDCSSQDAYKRLRELAMAGRVSMEEAADRLNDQLGGAYGDRRKA